MENSCLSQELKNGVWGYVPEQSFHGRCSVMFVTDVMYFLTIQQEMLDGNLYITTDTPWSSIAPKEMTVRKI